MNRAEWSKLHSHCMWPDCESRGTQTHEIVGGASRLLALQTPGAWLRLCQLHHTDLPSRPSEETLIKLLAIKLHNDPAHYNVRAVLELWRPTRRKMWNNDDLYEYKAQIGEMYVSLYGEVPCRT